MPQVSNTYSFIINCLCGRQKQITIPYMGMWSSFCACGTRLHVEMCFDTWSIKVAQLTIDNKLFIQNFPIDDIENGVFQMPKAILSYEALQLDSEGIPTEGAYKLKLEGNFKQHIEPMVAVIKSLIPSSDRTYDGGTKEWFFHEKYYPLMEQAFKGSHFQVSFTVRKEDFVELKRKQAEFAKQAGQSFATRQIPVEEDITKFGGLLIQANLYGEGNFDKLKVWTRQEAEKWWKKALFFFHPDLHPERAAQASELNEVWSRLKEGYYIK